MVSLHGGWGNRASYSRTRENVSGYSSGAAGLTRLVRELHFRHVCQRIRAYNRCKGAYGGPRKVSRTNRSRRRHQQGHGNLFICLPERNLGPCNVEDLSRETGERGGKHSLLNTALVTLYFTVPRLIRAEKNVCKQAIHSMCR